MLINDFCTVQNLDNQPGSIKAALHWNSHHAIFEGHFPGQPVVPGVCMLQITKELMELCLARKIALRESGQMKFLQFIDPRITPDVDILISFSQEENGLYTTSATLQKEKVIFFRFTGVFSALQTDEGEI
ncbi:3-hydroxyacyl-ACP dehydratase [Flavihumibacter fluvii]|uniref:3-hydroxyacyl-ACP dehydratase n=1 Tax=Flavihumibacter fluvii TaxID=2838157 RepID=UPI001BDE7EBE|nr:3-hydroxyacyl-ACP dehydratase [Flavihumibacter fluvii]ULQ51466.1 3-hydroxyacyl-ACP dehydratase [Flavihumibacter fluvii]